ncbi:MAG: hypothetical protein LBM25_00510 [Bacteroidales bacterium]|jgi:hypothetical protein|nr:hypothetical protein [Bacteroidales bacterium]
MLRRISLFILLIASTFLFPNISFGQNSISSPYSRYGIGEVDLFNNPINNAMGGVSYAFRRNNSINYLNPASYSGVDTMSLVFDIGFYSQWSYISNGLYSSNGNHTSLSHIAIAFPLWQKLKAAFGLMPISTVDFTTSQTTIDTIVGTHANTYSADGGLNKVFFGLAFSPKKNLAIGANFEYIFGNYYKASTTSFPDSSYMYSSRVENNYHVNAFNISLGLQYFYQLKNGDNLGLGLVYDFKSKFPTDNVLTRYTFTTSAGLDYMQDEIKTVNSSNHITYPSTLGVGLSYERLNNFFFGFDARYVRWSEFKLQTDYINQNLVDNIKVSLGGEYKPDAYGNFFQKSVYRLGVFYDSGMLEFNTKKINQYGVSLGIGFPIKKTNTMVNISFEYLKKGTTYNNLIKEDIFRIGLSFSAKDLWFFKRKYQ